MVTALMIKPLEHPVIAQLCDNRTYLDHAVRIGSDTECSATASHITMEIAVIYAQDISLQANRKIGKRLLCGAFYIVGVNTGKLRSLTDEEVVTYTLLFWEPEFFTEDEVIEAWVDNL